MGTGYQGFPRSTLKFFRDLEKNNDRDWFAAHRKVYDEEIRPAMIELVTLLAGDLREFAVDCVPERPEKTIYRIHRDTRFSKDKTPYKTHIAAHFQHRRLPKNLAGGFYFAISHASVGCGGGIYMPGPEQLAAVRAAIAEDYQAFRKLCSDKALLRKLGPLTGDALRRPPKGYAPDHPAADLLRMKQWYFYVDLDPKLALTPAVRKEISTRFRLVAPMVNWINDACVRALGDEEDLRPVRPEPMF
jgi:uncharacterized protein (TIGR02453 family)